METVGQRIEKLAARQGLAPGAALAKEFGVSYETLRKWRAGEIAPNRARQERISAVLKVPPEQFMHGVMTARPLSDEEWRLVGLMRTLAPEDQKTLLRVADAMQMPAPGGVELPAGPTTKTVPVDVR